MYVILDNVTSLNAGAYSALLGIAPSRLLSLANTSFTVDRLLFPSYTGCGSTSYNNMQAFERTIHRLHSELYALPPITPSAILVINRGSHNPPLCVRCIRNHDELVRSLRASFPGPEVIEFTEHSMTETVALFARTRLVIAPHGAGLTNMLFLPRCAAVVEIHTFHKERKVNYCYVDMALGLGLSYEGLAPIGNDEANVSAVLAAAHRLYDVPCRR
jgi:hypothetical protein